MNSISKRGMSTKTMVLGAILTALVIVLQLMGSFIHLGPFSISLVLLPIVIGAAMCGPLVSTWLGFVFSVVVLIMDAAAFLAVSVFGTVLTVLLKGTAAGLVAGLVYKLLEKKNRYLAVVAAAIVCPIVNTGIFTLGCFAFFMETIRSWGVAEGIDSAVKYLFIVMIGANFLVEFGTNILLSPAIVRLLNIRKKQA